MIEWNLGTNELVFVEKQPILIMFRNKTTDEDKEFMSIYQEAAQQLKGKILMAKSDIKEQKDKKAFMGQ